MDLMSCSSDFNLVIIQKLIYTSFINHFFSLLGTPLPIQGEFDVPPSSRHNGHNGPLCKGKTPSHLIRSHALNS